MIEVNIVKKLKDNQFKGLINFLYSLSTEICFTTFHNYHIEEELAVETLNEYKQRCKDKHRELQEIYDRKEAFLMKILKKIGVKNQSQFDEYKEHIFNSDMALCKKMDELLDSLINEKTTKDYTKIFPSIANDIKEIEVHMYDSVSVSIMPLDLVICNSSENILKALLDMKQLTMPVLINKQENCTATCFPKIDCIYNQLSKAENLSVHNTGKKPQILY